jgi:hypothetical protein
MNKSLPDWCLEIIDSAVFFGAIAWFTVLPALGLLWLVGALS